MFWRRAFRDIDRVSETTGQCLRTIAAVVKGRLNPRVIVGGEKVAQIPTDAFSTIGCHRDPSRYSIRITISFVSGQDYPLTASPKLWDHYVAKAKLAGLMVDL